MNKLDAIKEYQCVGCTNGPELSCYIESEFDVSCKKHCPGTMLSGIGTIFLGLPKGFNRDYLGLSTKISIFDENSKPEIGQKSSTFKEDGLYDNFNIPCWKHLDEHGNTLVRGLSPRINRPFLHIYLKDVRNQINCLELTKQDIENMD